MNLSKNKKLLIALVAVVLVTIPLTVSLLQQQQEQRTRAAGSSALTFSPTSSGTSPLEKKVGDTVTLDMNLDPGSNLVNFIRYQITYDSTKLQPVGTTPFTLNTASFPTNIEGPVLGTGTISQSFSIGADPTKAIASPTKAGTFTFKAIGPTTGSPTVVNLSSLTQILSVASTDQAGENVLATKGSAYIAITGSTSATLTPQPTAESTIVSLTVLLHGIGAAGDNPNPSGNTLSNKNPLHPQRDLDFVIYDSNNQLVATKKGSLLFDADDGTFLATVDLGTAFPTGKYIIKIKSDRYLRKLIPGIHDINNLENNELPEIDLVAGDINGDNLLNVLDYNAFLDCGYGELAPLPLADPNATYNTQECQAHTPAIYVDIDDNGIINSSDYNLFLRELSVQNGD